MSADTYHAVAPGRTIGILGGGQLGRMLAIAAAQMGLRTHIYAPDDESPAAQVANELTRADYLDHTALAAFAKCVRINSRFRPCFFWGRLFYGLLWIHVG